MQRVCRVGGVACPELQTAGNALSSGVLVQFTPVQQLTGFTTREGN
jgi:hypothetical protein